MRIGWLFMLCALGLVMVFSASAQAYALADRDSVPEPWSGWWWPMYHVPGVPSCPNCPHLWQGPGFDPNTPGPIYDLDTKYFWRPESIRLRAENWENDSGHVTNPDLGWYGHCGGMSCAQACEDDPPADCGALSREDLEGLLADLYAGVGCPLLTPFVKTDPGSLWRALQTVMRSDTPRAAVVDFYADTGSVVSQERWFWPVYKYVVDYDTFNGQAVGLMTLFYEDHLKYTDYARDSADYRFWCFLDANRNPLPGTGGWGLCHPPPGCFTSPDFAVKPQKFDTTKDTTGFNPYLSYTEIKKVIDHKLIILDDAYADSVVRYQFSGDSWVRRPGYSDSCWAAYEIHGIPRSYCCMFWSPRLGCDGLWNLYVWKTNPAGDQYVDSSAWFHGTGYGYFDQAVPPFDTWQLVCGPSYLTAGSKTLVLDDFLRWPEYFCYTYYDAFKLEHVGEGGDGGASSTVVALGDKAQRVRVMPNPARSTARISYMVLGAGQVDVVVYDVTGRAALRARQDVQRAGLQTATISVAGLPAGTYIARVTAKGVNAICRFVVCR